MKKTRSLYIFLLVSSVLLSVGFTDPYIGLTLLYALGIMLIISAVSMLLAPRFVKVEQKIDRYTTGKGEVLDYTVILKNSSLFFYPRVKITYDNTEILPYRGGWIPDAGLKARNTFRSKSQVLFPYRGCYDVGIKTIALMDPLGLFTYIIDDVPLLSVLVYPTFEKNYNLKIEENPQRLAANHDYLHEDYTSIEDVREYQPTDELRRVHWQLSAKRGNLLVKNFETLESHSVVLIIDAKSPPLSGKDKYSFEDNMVHHVASSAYKSIELGRKVSVFWGNNEHESMMIENESGIMESLEKLALLEFKEEGYHIPSEAYSSNIDNAIFYLWRLSGEIVETISQIKYQSIIPTVYFFRSSQIVVTQNEEQLLLQLEDQEIPVIYISER